MDTATATQQHKADLRRSLLNARQSIPHSVWQEKSQRICQHLQKSPSFTNAQTVLAYFSFRQEPDLSCLFSLPKQWGFPRCVEKSLAWHHWTPQSPLPLSSGTYGIVEPHPQSPLIDPRTVDLILVPAVAADVRGYRLGYGGGFYDRMLSLPQWQQARTIAIVFEFARLPQIPRAVWDRPLHGICTETGLFLPAAS